MATVLLKGLTKHFSGGVTAVDGVDLRIEDGELLVIVGPSGCGKSTTLRMIAGLESISSGSLQIDGQEMNGVPPKDRDIAMVFQHYALYPHMSVYKNMAFSLVMRGYSKAEIDARVREAAALLELSDLLERRPKALSGGQRQRVALGRAIVRNPKLFLFDEPLSNLDARLRVQMRGELSRLHRRLGVTTLYVTHDQSEAMTLGNRIVVMNEGRIQQIATPMELYRNPANRFVAGFIGNPPMNLIAGCLEEEAGALRFLAEGGGLALPLPAATAEGLATKGARKILLGLRPEDFGRPAGEVKETALVAGSVELVEPMGAENHIHLRAGHSRLVLRMDSTLLPAVGSAFSTPVNLRKLHFFDAETGQSLL